MPTIEEVDDDFSDPDDAPLEAPPPPNPKAKPTAASRATPTPQPPRIPSGNQSPFFLPTTLKGQHTFPTLPPEAYKESVHNPLPYLRTD